jgi:hypothetical protein
VGGGSGNDRWHGFNEESYDEKSHAPILNERDGYTAAILLSTWHDSRTAHLRSHLEHDAPPSRAPTIGRAIKATLSVTKQTAIRRVSVLPIEIQKDLLFINATADWGH